MSMEHLDKARRKRRNKFVVAVVLIALLALSVAAGVFVLRPSEFGCLGTHFDVSARDVSTWQLVVNQGERCYPIEVDRTEYVLRAPNGTLVVQGNVSDLDGMNGIRFVVLSPPFDHIKDGDRFDVLKNISPEGSLFRLMWEGNAGGGDASAWLR